MATEDVSIISEDRFSRIDMFNTIKDFLKIDHRVKIKKSFFDMWTITTNDVDYYFIFGHERTKKVFEENNFPELNNEFYKHKEDNNSSGKMEVWQKILNCREKCANDYEAILQVK